jgi:alpha-mannosidase
MYFPLCDLRAVAYWSKEPLPWTDRMKGKKIEIKPGVKWGELFDCAWFHFTGTVPPEAKGRQTVLWIDLNGEGCVFDGKGNPIQGLTSKKGAWGSHLAKRVVPVSDKARGGEKIDLWVDAGCNDLFGHMIDNGEFKEAKIAVRNVETRALAYDFQVLCDLMMNLPENTARHDKILRALHLASLELSDFTEAEAKKARAILRPELAKRGGDPSMNVSAVGHAHIDLMWLWPERESFRKGARTFSTALQMMDQYPDYIFGQSQPQIYEWMKNLYPGLYKRIKARVADGRWEPQGCMWVEADTNVSGGEALIRQNLYGKRFYREEFGVDVRHLWLPDVFGYSAAMPQILKKSGVDYFMTQKLSWSLVNKFPHHTFHWKGIDGSSVLAHMLPNDDYNSAATPGSILKGERNYFDKAVCENFLVLYGIGDGGGGPGAEHLERLDRMKNLSGMPPVLQEKAADFFKRIDRPDDSYATWSGELYLERHTGTYTTQARSKRFNRKMELAMRELEAACAMARLTAGAFWPKREIDRLWKELLLFQFHDILPGSSIDRVYDETLARYATHMETIEGLLGKARAALGGRIDTSAMRKPRLVSNSLSWERSGWIQVDGKWRRVIVPSFGHACVDASDPADIAEGLRAEPLLLENEALRVRFNKAGWITSVFDKVNGFEAVDAAGLANRLVVYDDWHDAWDIRETYDDKPPREMELVSVEARLDGPRAIVKQIRRFGESTLTQEIVLTEGCPRLDFVTVVDWRETHKMLRVQFETAIRADEAVCEIQFGSIKRPTHRNTSWDMAKFEICAHKWIDLSERSRGVALLNDCKYGHKALGNMLDLDLLRSTTNPGKTADKAVHHFTYALYPHEGDHAQGEVVRRGYELNIPLGVAKLESQKGSVAPVHSFVEIETNGPHGAVILETMKKAEDDNSIVLRLFEAHGGTVEAQLEFGFSVTKAELVDMMEENPQALKIRDGKLRLLFKPLEIHTLKLGV